MTRIEFFNIKIETETSLSAREMEELLIALSSAYTAVVFAIHSAPGNQGQPMPGVSLN